MSESALSAPDRAAVLATLDQARDAFLTTFAQVPDAALAYLPAGDEYALGALLLHLTDPLRSYATLLERLAPVGDGPLDYRDSADLALAARDAVLVARPTGAERPGLLADLAAAHDHFRDQLLATAPAAFDRNVPVLYPGSDDLYPTSPRAVAGWVIDHYHEHVPHVESLLRDWRAAHPA